MTSLRANNAVLDSSPYPVSATIRQTCPRATWNDLVEHIQPLLLWMAHPVRDHAALPLAGSQGELAAISL
jgi:hypothetical protein